MVDGPRSDRKGHPRRHRVSVDTGWSRYAEWVPVLPCPHCGTDVPTIGSFGSRTRSLEVSAGDETGRTEVLGTQETKPCPNPDCGQELTRLAGSSEPWH